MRLRFSRRLDVRDSLACLLGCALILGAAMAAPAQDLAYIANLRAATVSVVDLATDRVTGRIAVGADPNGVAVSPDGGEVWITNFASNTVSVIDGGTREVVATFPVEFGPVGIVFAPDGSEVYVASKTAGVLSIVDAVARSVAVVPIDVAGGANGVAVTPDGAFIYVTNSGRSTVSVVDRLTRQVVATIPVGRGPSRAAMDPIRSLAYVAAYNAGEIAVIDTQTREVEATIAIAGRPTGLAVTADGSRLYVATEEYVFPIDLATRQVLPAVEGILRSGTSMAAAVTAAGNRVYLTSLGDGTTSVVDVGLNRVVRVLCGEAGPFAIALAPSPSARALAWINEPLAGTKVYPGTRLRVRIVAMPGNENLAGWRLALIDPAGGERLLASGTSPVVDEVVAELAGQELESKGAYSLRLEVEPTAGEARHGRVGVVAPASQYALLPLDGGNDSLLSGRRLEVDGSGQLVAYDQRGQSPVFLLDPQSGDTREFTVEQEFAFWDLSSDAATLVYPRYDDAMTFVDVATGDLTYGLFLSPLAFQVDRAGFRVALLQGVATIPDLLRNEVFYYDQLARELRQVTVGPIPLPSRYRGFVGPVISADASRVAFGSRLPQAEAPPTDDIEWRFYVYDTQQRSLRYVAGLERGRPLSGLTISGDGHWLGFATSQPQRSSLSTGALLNVDTGVIESPIGALDGFETFDAVVTPDGDGVVVSTAADLDPAVGNADGNVELFLLNRESNGLTQITETIGNSSHSVSPSISDDGRAAAFRMVNMGAGTCPAAGPQRDEATGFYFGRTYTVPRRPGNRPPELDPVADALVMLRRELLLRFHATDGDGDRIVFFLQPVGGVDLPDESVLVSDGDGNATFTWFPRFDEAIGDHTFRLGAFDSSGDFALREFNVRVCAAFSSDNSCAPDSTETPTETSMPEPPATSTPSPTLTRTATGASTPSRTPTASVTRSPSAPTVTSTAVPPSATSPPPHSSTPTVRISSDNGCQTRSGDQAGSGMVLVGAALALWRSRRVRRSRRRIR